MDLEMKIFKLFPISLWELKIARSVANSDPRGMVGRIYVGNH